MNEEAILIVTNFIFMDWYDPHLLILLQDTGLDKSGDFDMVQFKTNALSMIVEICEDRDIQISSELVDSLIQKIIFGNFKSVKDLDPELVKNIRPRLFKALAIKDPKQTKKSYDHYMTFKQYQI